MRTVIAISTFLISYSASAGWDLKERIDPFDKEKTTSIISISKDLYNSKFPVFYKESSLILRCRNKNLDLIFAFSNRVVGEEDLKVDLRIGEKKFYRIDISRLSDGTGVGWTGDKSVVEFDRMAASEDVAIRIFDNANGETTAGYDISGFKEAAKPVLAACNVKR